MSRGWQIPQANAFGLLYVLSSEFLIPALAALGFLSPTFGVLVGLVGPQFSSFRGSGALPVVSRVSSALRPRQLTLLNPLFSRDEGFSFRSGIRALRRVIGSAKTPRIFNTFMLQKRGTRLLG